MKNRMIPTLLLLGVCACCTASAFAQSFGRSHRIAITPETETRFRQQGELTHSAALALDSGDYAKAEALARESVALGPDSGLEQELLAQALYFQGKDREAFEVYKSIADAGGAFPRNELPYALLLLNSGQYAKAVKAYNTGIKFLGFGALVRANGEFSVEDPQPKALAAAIHVAMGADYNGRPSWGQHPQDDKALAEYKTALDLQPASALANYYYGFGLHQLHKTAEARAAYRQAASLDTGDVYTAASAALKKLPKN